ncbi:hypothetical protein QQS21_011775 [Conoideocrella luteorostrata]|uniref:BZIP domain-containing protein n=1 Tax=Conoideocrella luteorostrata TaxID=1105319 RepID=A0AAJ0CF70_9HYPO|nr:hypothetical protein QQS21_011775 [Conoideocrella luteorostrata]
MTPDAQKANLARIRDNQRRSRARRREYLQDLEQRLRACEVQGVEASTEVQTAARRVAEENRLLRELLHKCGATDEYIAHYLRANNPEFSQGQNMPVAESGSATQPLQQLMLPRRPAHLDPGAQFAAPNQSSRETSIASGSTTNSSAWESSQSTMTGYSHHQQQIGVSPSSIGSSDHHHYSPSVFSAQPATASFQNPPSGHMMNDLGQGLATTQSGPFDNRTAMNYHFQTNPYNDPTNRYGPHGGPC